MAKVSNESRLIMGLFVEKAKAHKEFSDRNAARIGENEIVKAHHYRKGIEWAEKTLAGIVSELEHPEQ